LNFVKYIQKLSAKKAKNWKNRLSLSNSCAQN